MCTYVISLFYIRKTTLISGSGKITCLFLLYYHSPFLSHRMNFTLLKLNCLKIWYPVISGLLGFVQSELRGMKTSRWHLIPAYLWSYWFILGRVGLDSGYTQNCQSLQFGKVKLGALGVTLTSGKSSALWFQLRLWSSFSHIHVTIHTYTYIAKQSRTIHILFF